MFDNEFNPEWNDLQGSTEKMSFVSFQRRYTAYRQSAIPRMLVDLNDAHLQLPNRASLYTVRNFLGYMDDTTDIFPDVSFPLFRHEEWRKFLRIETSIPDADSRPFPVTDHVTFMPGQYRGQVMHFFAQNKDFHRTMDDFTTDKAPNVLACHEFAPLLALRARGNLVGYRKFEIVLRAILNKILATQSPRYHYIHIPLSDTLYTRSSFQRTPLAINQLTLKGNTDPSYYFLIHFIGFLLNEVVKESDVKVLNNDLGFMQKDDMSLLKTNSMFNRIDPDVLDTINIVFTHGDRCIIYNLGDLRAFTTSIAFVDKVIRHINLLKLVSAHDHDETVTAELDDHAFHNTLVKVQGATEIPSVNDEATDDPEVSPPQPEVTPEPQVDKTTVLAEVIKAPVVVKPTMVPKPITPAKPVPQHVAYVNTVRDQLNKTVERAQAVTQESVDTPAKRAKTLYKKHMAITLAGKTIAEHLATPNPEIHQSSLDFLSDHLIDQSMKDSSIANMDELYIRHMAHKDLAKTLTSFVKHGFFVSDLKEQHVVDKFNRTTTYRVRMLDVNGKSHAFSFKLPKVDDRGFMLVNGVTSRMVKQNVNIPICKISDTRVNLSSDLNKTLVERVSSVANQYNLWINKYLTNLIRLEEVVVSYGKLKVGSRVLPYEYCAIGSRYTGVKFKGFAFSFDYDHRFANLDEDTIDRYKALEVKYGTFAGTGPQGTLLFWDLGDVIHQVTPDGAQKLSYHFASLLNHLFSKVMSAPSMLSEWTELKILSLNLPVVHVLAFQYGLTDTLKYINLNYKRIPKGERYALKSDEIAVKFADCTLVFSRYPLSKSLVASGLNKWDLSKFALSEFDAPDGYYALFNQKSISSNYLRGITAFFDFFMDATTEENLLEMHEPTNVRDLLLRATEMLSTTDAYQASSMRNHRMRGYERFAGTLYKEMARELASWREKRNQKSGFSINPEAVFLGIMSDATVLNSEVLNPIQEMKGGSQVTYSGSGGRTAQSFVVNDRVFPEDGVGILSEATPDSGKVAMTAYTVVNPRLKNLRGMVDPNTDNTPLDPTQMLSTAGLLIPGAAQDDGKRLGYISIQASHVVPCENYDVGHVRTGYETVIAHRVSDVFSVAAQEDGKVVSIDEKTKTVTIQYEPQLIVTSGALTLPLKTPEIARKKAHHENAFILVGSSQLSNYPLGKVFSVNADTNAMVLATEDGIGLSDIDKAVLNEYPDLVQKVQKGQEASLSQIEVKLTGKTNPGQKGVYQYGERFTPVSGSLMKQDLVLNCAVGDSVKRGDILLYNKGFFTADPYSKQVAWGHGVMVNVAFVEKSETLEDGSIISKELGEQLTMSPAHHRTIQLTNKVLIRQIAALDSHVETTDPLLVIEENDLDALTSLTGSESTAFWNTLNRKSPKANYHGRVADIDVYYSCPYESLHPTIQAVVRQAERRNRTMANALKGSPREYDYLSDGRIPVGQKYHGVEFADDTVVIEFTIAESLTCGVGDKCVIGGANKTVVSSVMENRYYTQSGLPVDALYGCASAAARIVNSVYVMGIGNRVMREIQDQAVAEYFK